MERIFNLAFADAYSAYVKKVERKGQTVSDIDKVLCWLTGFDSKTLKKHVKDKTTIENLFKSAKLNSHAELITGTICGVRIENIQDPLMKKVGYMDKVVDELAKGRPLERIFRTTPSSSAPTT